MLSKVGKGFAKGGAGRSGVISGSRLAASGAKKKAASADMKAAAKQAAARDLPAGWQAFTDPKTDRPYYYNEDTKVTQWDKPT